MACFIGGEGFRGASLSTTPPRYPIFDLYLPYPLDAVAFFAVFVGGMALFNVSLALGRRARLDLARIVTSAADVPPNGYVLYLRPFTWDAPASEIAPSAAGSPAAWAPIIRSAKTHEERIAALFRQFGPTVALGRTDEVLPGGSGAYRAYVPRHDWHDPVRGLIENARLILLGAGTGSGTIWEYAEVIRLRDPYRLVIIITDLQVYEDFRKLANLAASNLAAELRRREGYFWKPPVLPSLGMPAQPSKVRAFHLKATIRFSGDWIPYPELYFPPDSWAERSRVLFRDEVSRYFGKAIRPVIDHVRSGPLRLRLAGWSLPPDIEPPPTATLQHPVVRMRRSACIELLQAFLQAVSDPAGRDSTNAVESDQVSQAVDVLATEVSLPDWAQLDRLAKGELHEALYLRADRALHDPEACPSCGRDETHPILTPALGRLHTRREEAVALKSALKHKPDPRSGWNSVAGGLACVAAAALTRFASSTAAAYLALTGLVVLINGLFGVAANRRVQRGVQTAVKVWLDARYCSGCGGVFYNFGKAPAGAEERTLMSAPDFQKLVWTAGGYAHRL